MISSEKASDLLGDVKGGSHFKLHMGTNIANLRQLSEALDIMADATYKHHVTPKKNDFAAWVMHAVGDAELAKSMDRTKDRKRLALKISSRVNYLDKLKNKNKFNTQEFLTYGAADFVLGAMIGFVIGMIVAVMV